MSARRGAAIVCGILAVVIALVPLARGEAEIPIGTHHLYHAAAIACAALCGVLVAPTLAATNVEHPAWLVAAIGAPLGAMLLMWPSEYAWLDRHPAGHVVEHLGLAVLGFLTTYGGQRYARGIGWAAGGLLVAMAILAAFGFGVAPPPTA